MSKKLSTNEVLDEVLNLETLLPESFPISVVLESAPALSKWIDRVWKAIAVIVGSQSDLNDDSPQLIKTNDKTRHYLCGGLKVTLFKDECESYYFNLMSETPRCYVVAHVDDIEEAPDPFLITMSFDEAHSYLEGEDEIYDVDVPAELYRWTEAFILHHYAPQKKVKRKRTDWKKPTEQLEH